jgi:hypothetical protein
MQYYQRNHDQVAFWNPIPAADCSSEGAWQQYFAEHSLETAAGRRLDLGIFFKDRPDRLAGTLECRNISPRLIPAVKSVFFNRLSAERVSGPDAGSFCSRPAQLPFFCPVRISENNRPSMWERPDRSRRPAGNSWVSGTKEQKRQSIWIHEHGLT